MAWAAPYAGQVPAMTIPPVSPTTPATATYSCVADSWPRGGNDRAIRRQLADGTWVKLRHGAYLPATVWEQLDESGRHSLRARAVRLQASTGWCCRTCPALEYERPHVGPRSLRGPRLTRRTTAPAAGRPGCASTGELEEGDVVTRNGVEVMSATRLAPEIPTVADVEASLCVVQPPAPRRCDHAEGIGAAGTTA